MDMYQKRKMRKENNNTNVENSKTNINWYSGNMFKTKSLVQANFYIIDVFFVTMV